MIYSFDVFDTLITRKLGTPKGIFAIIQDKLTNERNYEDLPDILRENFFELRIAAEQAAGRFYNNDNSGEITISQIYSVIGQSYSLNQEKIEMLIDLEKQTEYCEVYPIPNNIATLFSLIDSGERVVLISDMYMDGSTIRRMLCKVDSRFKQLPIYVSSDYGKRKSTGALFAEVRRIENIRYDEWVHIGDNDHSDDYVPALFGIETRPFFKGKVLLPVENRLIQMFEKNVYLQRIVGNAIYCRRVEKNDVLLDSIPFKYGTFILPMIIDGYVKWIIEEAFTHNICTLYFIARDGYLIKKMADWWIERKGYTIRTKYIYGSRYTWRTPALSETNWDIKALCRNSHSLKYFSALDMANIFNLSKEEFRPFIPKDIPEDVVIGSHSRDYIANELENNDAFKQHLLSRVREARKAMEGYLRQEIDLDEKFAFVELYGGGYTQREVATVLTDMGAEYIHNFYFHLTKDLSNEKCLFHAYMPYGRKAANLIERFFSAPEGRTVGYERGKDGKYFPLLDDESEILNDYGQEEMRKGFESFLNNYDGTDLKPGFDVIQELEMYIQNSPDEGMLSYLGDMPVDASENKKDLYTYAPKLNDEDIIRIDRWAFLSPRSLFYDGLNINYSLKRCTEEQKDLINDLKNMNDSNSDYQERDYYLKEKGYRINHLVRFGLKPAINHRRVVLYGAGKVGKLLHYELDLDQDVETVLWVDRNYKEKSGMGISAPEQILKENFDFIIVAIIKKPMALSAKEMLVGMGIPVNKILELIE